MCQPPGYEDSLRSHYVCKLNKAIYGLKQAPKAQNDELKSSLLGSDFVLSRLDTFLFYLGTAFIVILLLVYVDDVIVMGNHPQFVA